MSRVGQVLGIPPEVARGVDTDRAAYLRGPDTLQHALDRLTRHQLEARYRALLTESTYTSARAARMAWEEIDRAEQADEQQQTRLGGNR